MLTRHSVLTGALFLAVFGLQLATVDQIHLPFGGFSIFLIFVLSWSALSSPEVGAVAGFFAGFLLDIAPTASGPIGEWTLILTIVGFGIAFLRYGDDSLRTNPLSLVVMVAFSVVVSMSAFLLLTLLLGSELGNAKQAAKTILGNGLWTLAIAPFVLPIASRLHRAVFETREIA